MGIWFSYSAWKQYRTCPKQYELKRVKKLEPVEPDSRHNAIVGSVVQSVYEDFYNEEIWRRGASTSEELLRRAETYFEKFLKDEYIDFDDPSCRYTTPQEPLNEILEIVPKVLLGIKRERFLGPYAKSEVRLKVRFGPEHFLYGYIDFIIRKQDDTVLLLDGKASRHREKNVDVNQLYYYALLYSLRYHRLPDKLGFFYYRFADDPELAMDWIPVDRKKILELRVDIEDALYDIAQKRLFPAQPNYKHCRWCPWEITCKERQEQKQANRKKRNKNKPKMKADFGKNSQALIGFNNLDD